MEFRRITRSGGDIDRLWRQWEDKCTGYNEDFSDYASASLPVLRELAEGPDTRRAGCYSLIEGTSDSPEYIALCQLNVALLPGYDGEVLRMRHLVLNPDFDFSDSLDEEEYGHVLAEIFAQITHVATTEMPARHVKMHLRSWADRSFFGAVEERLKRESVYSSVALRGAWLYLKR